MATILFIVPPYHCWGVQTIGTWPPVQLAYLAGAAAEAGHEAVICDAMNKDFSFDDVRAEIERVAPDYVMTMDYLPVSGAVSTASVPAALKTLSLAKLVDPSIITLIGGPHPTFLYDEILSDDTCDADYVLRGEAEETLRELLSAIPAGQAANVAGIAFRDGERIVATEVRPHIKDLDTLTAAWHLLDWDDYHYNIDPWGRMASILTTRGCMMGCSFCSHRAFWRSDWRSRDPRRVIDEMRLLVEEHKVEFITFIDPYPTFDRDRWELQLDLIIEANLPVKLLMETRVEDIIRDEKILHKYHEAGVIHVYVGVESGSDAMLESLNKGTDSDMNKRALDLLREHDIMSEASFMVGFPDETWESIDKTIVEAVRLNPDIAVFPVITPMPFTPLHEEMKDRIRVTDYSKYNLMTPIVEPYDMSLDDVYRALAKCYMTFYGHKMREVAKLEDGFKKRYMMSAFEQMMKDYGKQFDFLGENMPEGMKGIAGIR
ncbi:MAG: B12-binding domain-containing radical SAM protein [Actinobacteria bacterium HGW-Actinobacteria-6]|jgi:anaerobic magnesium-protoporphyrin IX monomethyl ester cyclase|nr:MAG: B12-binding domain-containing radical SAM protein [Actinobacteria bacterium HGW-Actinobacteria-6]